MIASENGSDSSSAAIFVESVAERRKQRKSKWLSGLVVLVFFFSPRSADSVTSRMKLASIYMILRLIYHQVVPWQKCDKLTSNGVRS